MNKPLSLCRPSQEMKLMPIWRGEWRDPFDVYQWWDLSVGLMFHHLKAMGSYEGIRLFMAR